MTTDTITPPTPTEIALAEALVEDSGRRMGDSGDFYGRGFETERKRLAAEFGTSTVDVPELEPAKLVESRRRRETAWGNPYPTLDVWHYLKARLELAEELDAEFREWAKGRTSSWEADMEEWVEEVKGGRAIDGGYTYNFENALSQDIVWARVEIDDEPYVFIRIHTGCDARAGFSSPRLFTETSEGVEYQVDEWGAICQGRPRAQTEVLPGMEHVEREDGYYEPHHFGSNVDDEDEQIDFEADEVVCPVCGTAVEFYAPEPY